MGAIPDPLNSSSLYPTNSYFPMGIGRPIAQHILNAGIIVTFFVTIENDRIFVRTMNNTRFATAIHILTLLADNPGKWLNSEWIAGSININPVVVRRELKVLQEQGWVASRKGKDGGSTLNISGDKISLADIYSAVKNTEVLGKKNLHTNTRCPIGKQINIQLEKLYSETDAILVKTLGKKTLSSFTQQFR